MHLVDNDEHQLYCDAQLLEGLAQAQDVITVQLKRNKNNNPVYEQPRQDSLSMWRMFSYILS